MLSTALEGTIRVRLFFFSNTQVDGFGQIKSFGSLEWLLQNIC